MATTSPMSCGDKGYYDLKLSHSIYPSVYNLWANREQQTHRPYVMKHNDTKQLLRRILVDYLAEFCEKNKVNSLSRALAICLFDHFDSSTLLTNLCLAYPYNRDLLCADHAVLLMQSCLLVAAKVEDIHYNVPSATDFRNVTMQDSAVTNYLLSCDFPIKPGSPAFDSVVSRLKLPKFPLENYRDMELRVLRQFNWFVNIPTLSTFLGAFITELNLLQKSAVLNPITAQLPMFIKELVTHAEYLAELALQRPELLYADLPSYLAAACMHGAFTINTNNSWNMPPAVLLVRGVNLVHQAVQDLQVFMNAAISRVAPQVQVDSPRFMQLLGAVLTSHNENQGEKLPATPPPDAVEIVQNANITLSYQQSPVPMASTPQNQLMGRNCRSINGKHSRSQHQAQQRLQPYPLSGSTASVSNGMTSLSGLTTSHGQHIPTFLEQLTPPETPPVLGANCGKSMVGARCISGSKQRVIVVLNQK